MGVTTNPSPVANGECKIVMGRTTGWGRRPHLIKYLLYMIGVSAEKYKRKIGNNEINNKRRNCANVFNNVCLPDHCSIPT